MNTREYERLVATIPCDCTPADFEWLVSCVVQSTCMISPRQFCVLSVLSYSEWGYRRNKIIDECVLDGSFETNVPPNCTTGYVSCTVFGCC